MESQDLNLSQKQLEEFILSRGITPTNTRECGMTMVAQIFSTQFVNIFQMVIHMMVKIGQQRAAVQKDGHSLLEIVILFQLTATQFLMVSNTRKVFSLPDVRFQNSPSSLVGVVQSITEALKSKTTMSHIKKHKMTAIHLVLNLI